MIVSSGKITEKPFSSCKRERGLHRIEAVGSSEQRAARCLGGFAVNIIAEGCGVADVIRRRSAK